MAWRPYENLIEGELDNSRPGQVTGSLRFLGLEEPVRLELKGDFLKDIKGKIIRLKNDSPADRNAALNRSGTYMKGFAPVQKGEVGDMTAGLPPYPYVNYPYIEWYSEKNGRVVLELEQDQIEIIEPAINN